MRSLIAMLVCLLGLAAAAKTPQFVIRGNITQADTTAWVPLPNVYVTLTAVDGGSQPLKYKLLTGNDSTKVTGQNGEMRLLVDGGQGKYILTLDREGYDPLVKDVEVKFKNQSVVWLGNLSMRRERHNELKELEVVATAIKLVVKGDTMIYNADAFKLAEGSMLDALVKQLDGVELSADGQITVNGRKVSSLLLNGKDFFKGDPSVALENLPAYTVKNLKVYDKAAEDDYLTKSSNKLARQEDTENLVMDVHLKKEFNVSGMGTLEGGYGTADRWLGKAFGLGFTDKVRLSAYVNANNVQDTETGSRGGSWGGNSGLTTREMGGMDYMYENDKTRINGNVRYSYTDHTSERETAQTRYLDPDIYRRSKSLANTYSHSLSTSHELKQKWSAVYFGADWDLNWNKSNSQARSWDAEFNELPIASTRTAALDSVFYRPDSKYLASMLSRLYKGTNYGSSSLSTSGELEATIRTENMQGRVNLEAGGSYSTNEDDMRSLYLQTLNADSKKRPTNSDRYSTSRGSSYNARLNANYNRDWTSIANDTWQNRFSLRTRLSYDLNHSDSDYRLDTITPVSHELLLPSLSTPAGAMQDLADSYNSIKDNHNGRGQLSLSFNREPLAPDPEGFNPSFYANGSVSYNLKHENLNYHVMDSDPELLSRTTNNVTASSFIGMNAGNDYYYSNLSLRYSNSISDPSLNLFLKNRTNTNPLYIYENNASGLRSSFTNNVELFFMRVGRKVHNNLNTSLSWSKTDNAVGQWSKYDPTTGITTAKPMNIDGNWNSSASASYSHPFGKREQFTPSIAVNGSYNNSVDFQSTGNEPVKSTVHNTNLSGSLSFNYKFNNGSNFTLGGSPSWQYATSQRERFNTVDAMTYSAWLSGVIELPANIQIQSRLNYQARRGYEEAAMNTDQWLWNASATKSILKGNVVFKLTAVDILGQVDPVSLNVNAQGRTEAWSNTLPRYVMLSVLWRINGGTFGGRGTGGAKGGAGGRPGGNMPAARMGRGGRF